MEKISLIQQYLSLICVSPWVLDQALESWWKVLETNVFQVLQNDWSCCLINLFKLHASLS